MYENENLRQTVTEAAKELIKNQYKAGFANTTLNYELHDYNFKGENAGEQIMDKILSDSGSDFNNMLSLRLLTQLKCSTFESKRNYLGEASGNGCNLYTPLGYYPKDVLQVLSDVTPKGTELPSILTVSQLGSQFITKLHKIDGNRLTEVELVNNKNYGKEPNTAEINAFLAENGANAKNVLGLKGAGAHCQAYVNTDIKALDGNSTLNIVSESSRRSVRGIIGFLRNVAETVKGLFSSAPAEPQKASVNEPAKEKSEENKEKGTDHSSSKSRSKDMTDDFEVVGDEYGDDFDFPAPDNSVRNEINIETHEDFVRPTPRVTQNPTRTIDPPVTEHNL
jgi:hypothetical protein